VIVVWFKKFANPFISDSILAAFCKLGIQAGCDGVEALRRRLHAIQQICCNAQESFGSTCGVRIGVRRFRTDLCLTMTATARGRFSSGK
jgi:hypothetical protein